MSQNYAVGIDLGTTYSCVSVYRNGVAEIIPVDGDRTTASYVQFTEDSTVVGNLAKSQISRYPTSTVHDAKRLVGRNFSDQQIQRDISHWPFKVIQGENDKPLVQVKVGDKLTNFAPEEISARVIQKMVDAASEYLGSPVTKAVITVPAYFNNEQRQLTKAIGTICKLDVLRIINEPTAAAMAYGLDNKQSQNILVFDLGGGTFDVSLLSVDEGMFEVLATSGDTHLGGEDFDNLVAKYLIEQYNKQFKTKKTFADNPRALAKIKTAAEKAKRALSQAQSTSIEIDGLDGEDFQCTLSRAAFDDICKSLFLKTLVPVDKVLTDAKISKNEVGSIVLVGGSTRIPKIQEILKEHFGGKELHKNINPDECVAVGAAIQAAILNNTGDETLKDICLVDVVPLTLALETAGGIATSLIPRNTRIPAKHTQIFSTHSDNQPSANIRICEGERTQFSNNNLLGEFELKGIKPQPRGVPELEVTIEVDANGIMNVTACDKASGSKNNLTITNNKNRYSKADLERFAREAEEYAEQDKLFKEKKEAQNSLESSAYSFRNTVSEEAVKTKMTQEDQDTINEEVNKVLEWVSENANSSSIGKEDFDNKLKELEDVINPILKSFYSENPELSKGQTPDENQMAEAMKNMTPEQQEKMAEMMKNMGAQGAQA